MAPKRSYTAEFKFRCVLQLLNGERTLAQLSREHGIRDTLLCQWRTLFLERGAQLFAPQASASSAEQARIAQLERLIGQLSIELEASKKASRWLDSHSPNGALS